ncbi:MAG: hypothetical protein WAO52_14995 [Prolixibacteraceae bacterium]
MNELKSDQNKKADKDFVRRLEKYAESTQKAIDYSIERFDILIISLSSSGLLLSIGFVKDIIGNMDNVNPFLLKLTWFLFGLSLIMNLVSQVTGYYANKLDLKVTNDIIRTKKGKESKLDQGKLDRMRMVFNSATMGLNAGSLACLISGVVTLIVFISQNV